MEQNTNINTEENNSSDKKSALNSNISIGIGLNIVSWLLAMTTDNHNLIIVGVVGCLIGAFFCFRGKNYILVALCIFDAYLLFDMNNDLKQIDKEMQKIEQDYQRDMQEIENQ